MFLMTDLHIFMTNVGYTYFRLNVCMYFVSQFSLTIYCTLNVDLKFSETFQFCESLFEKKKTHWKKSIVSQISLIM